MKSRMNLWGREPSQVSTPTPVQTPPRRPTPTNRPTTPPPPEQPAPEKPLEAGSWEKPRQELPVHDPGDMRRKYWRASRVPKDKSRRHTMTFSCSDEEAALLRAHAATLDMAFREWVRNVLFREMGRRLPSRKRG